MCISSITGLLIKLTICAGCSASAAASAGIVVMLMAENLYREFKPVKQICTVTEKTPARQTLASQARPTWFAP